VNRVQDGCAQVDRDKLMAVGLEQRVRINANGVDELVLVAQHNGRLYALHLVRHQERLDELDRVGLVHQALLDLIVLGEYARHHGLIRARQQIRYRDEVLARVVVYMECSQCSFLFNFFQIGNLVKNSVFCI
jgi:hypothetical protein